MSNPRTKYEAKVFQMSEDQYIYRVLTQENPDLAARDAFLKSYLKMDKCDDILLSALAFAVEQKRRHAEYLYSGAPSIRQKTENKYKLARSAVSDLKAFIALHCIQKAHPQFAYQNHQQVEITRMPTVIARKY